MKYQKKTCWILFLFFWLTSSEQESKIVSVPAQTAFQGKKNIDVNRVNFDFPFYDVFKLEYLFKYDNNGQQHTLAFPIYNSRFKFYDLSDPDKYPPLNKVNFVVYSNASGIFTDQIYFKNSGATDILYALRRLLELPEFKIKFSDILAMSNNDNILEEVSIFANLNLHGNAAYWSNGFYFGYDLDIDERIKPLSPADGVFKIKKHFYLKNRRFPKTNFDVIVHEFGHFITELLHINTTEEGGQGESGALGEAFGDVLGEYITQKTIGTIPIDGSHFFLRWVHDEGIKSKLDEKSTILYSRSLINPSQSNNPDTYGVLEFNWIAPNDLSNDQGGIHKNSTVASHFFYLLSEGGDGINSLESPYIVQGIGIDLAFEVYFNAWKALTGTIPTFQDFADATVTAAKELFLPNQAEKVKAVKDAWLAVGIEAKDFDYTFDFIINEADCGQANGKLEATVVNAQNVVYTWTDGNDTHVGSIWENRPAGNFQLTIDVDGLTFKQDIQLNELKTILLEVNNFPQNSCTTPDGRANIVVKNVFNDQIIPLNELTVSWNKELETQTVPFQSGTTEVSDLEAGDYSVYVKRNADDCEEVYYFTIEAKQPNIEILEGGNRVFCQSQPPETIKISIGSTDCVDCTYTWTTENGTINEQAADGFTIDVPPIAADYTLTATTPLGCISSYTTNLQIEYIDCTECDDGSFDFFTFSGVDPCKGFTIEGVTPIDPNEIIGPEGYGDPHWVSINDELPYIILFENDPEFAKATARRVEVTHQLREHIDPLSFRVGNFNFANLEFVVPNNKTFYAERLDVRDSLGVYVDVTAGIDISKNRAFWILEAIDPDTGLPPIDPNVGLLPINDSITRRGEGQFNFTVRPKSTSSTGDTIFAKAKIIFDENENIETNQVFNVIDALPPSSMMEPLLSNMDSTSFTLSWEGVDDLGGSSLKHYNLFVAEENRPFLLYQSNLTDTTLVFTGDYGSSYCFYVEAVDNVANVEEKTSADACTTVGGDVTLQAKVFLEGAFDTTSLLMRDIYRSTSILPLVEPYTDMGFIHVRGGGEKIDNNALDTTGADAITDWIFVELRDKTDPSLVIATRSALLQRDGDIVDTDGVSPLAFGGTYVDSFYVAVKHRNHMGVRTSEPIYLDYKDNGKLNFTSTTFSTFGTNAQKQVGNNMLLFAGDINKDGQINAVDKNLYWRVQNGQPFAYAGLNADLNLDGAVNAVDINLYWRINNSIIEQLD